MGIYKKELPSFQGLLDSGLRQNDVMCKGETFLPLFRLDEYNRVNGLW